MLTVTNPEDINWATMPKEDLLLGNALDSFVTLHLAHNLTLPKESQQINLLLSKCIPIFNEMEEGGLDVNTKLLTEITDNLIKDISVIQKSLDNNSVFKKFCAFDSSVTEFKLSSKLLNGFFKWFDNQVETGQSEDLLDFIGVNRSPKTNQYSFNEVNLLKIESEFARLANKLKKPYPNQIIQTKEEEKWLSANRLIQDLMKLRRMKKLHDSYFATATAIIEREKSSKLYCNYNLTGTVTGRISCEGMSYNRKKYGVSMHTLPRNTDFNFRDVITPSEKEREDGWLFVTVDYSTMELRVMAQACQDPAFKTAFQNGDDLHLLTAAKIFNKREEDVTKEERQTGKMVNFLTLYGGGPKRLAEELQISILKAKTIIKDYNKAFPNIDRFKKKVIKYLTTFDQSLSLFGRVRRLKDTYSTVSKDKMERFRVERQAVNAIIQSTASDILLATLVNLDFYFKEKNIRGRLVATVHDSIELVIHPSDLFTHFQEIMELFHKPDLQKAGISTLYSYPLQPLTRENQQGSYLKESPISEWEIPFKVDIEVGPSFGSNIGIDFEESNGKYLITNPYEVSNYINNIYG
ncbi:hypothetical protein HOE37_06475 [Candidatus Woesearchaeota archaeon]|jgi:DNA polymerase I-like protein with 3'-5' exonuclease and polymerase domains|nr:hypothetical protein [Candidatus Woesearchaeota archaeon]